MNEFQPLPVVHGQFDAFTHGWKLQMKTGTWVDLY